MKYPMIEICNPLNPGVTTYREMTPEEYNDQLNWYKQLITDYKQDDARRIQEYRDYLLRWFGDSVCDGLQDFATRKKFHHLPMSMNVYFN